MSRFLKDTDYAMQIRSEIKRLLDGSTVGDTEPPLKLLRAENTAISQIRKYLSGRIDCDAIFNAVDDARDEFIITICIDIALYHLYSQTGNKDIPTHRQTRYDDALEWLRDAGKGEINTDLPSNLTDDNPGEVRLFSKPPENHRW